MCVPYTMMWTLVAGLSILLQFASGFVSAGSTHRTATTELRMGGYDATIGAAPSTPIQFFTLVSGSLVVVSCSSC